ncbi:MAG: RNA-guided endonuclease TnpB family protein [Eubacteriales bacterium]|nr:RNA-guided endonuclease TnpB family protein [Eubacteriales bacterium]
MLPAMKDMPYHIGVTMKLYPSTWQKHLIAVNDGAKRAVRNLLVAYGNERYQLSKTVAFVPAYRDRIDFLDSVRKSVAGIKNALPFLYGKDVDEQCIANAVKNYRTAWKNQKERHTGVPTFIKKSADQSYQTNAHYYPNGSTNVRFTDRCHVMLPKLGRVRCAGSPKYVEMMMARCDVRIGAVTIRKDAVREYWVSFSLGSEMPFRTPLPRTGSMIGIDLNLIDLVNTSDGMAVPNERFLVTSAEKLAKQQRKLSRKYEASKNSSRSRWQIHAYQQQRIKVAYTHRKISRQREDYLHRISKHLIENQDVIAAEDLKVRNLIKDHHLVRAITDAGWRTLLTMLQYKSAFYGKRVVLVPPQNTTQTCSCCGYILKGEERLTLIDRDWTCPNCRTYHLRDVNAANVILKKGLAILATGG